MEKERFSVLLVNGNNEIYNKLNSYFNVICFNDLVEASQFYLDNSYKIDFIINANEKRIMLSFDDKIIRNFDENNIIESIKNHQSAIIEYDFSRSMALSMLDNNERIFRKLLQRYYAEYTNLADILHQLIFEGKFNEIKMYIHKIKGLSLNIGSEKLYNISKVLHDRFNEKEITKEEIDYFIHYHDKILDYIKEVIKE